MNATPLSLYIHFPWCVRKCPYCDFNSHALDGDLPEDRYVETLLRDLDIEMATEKRPSLHSIFLGGGTPSLFSPGAINLLLDGIRRYFDISGCEITLEANPGTFDQQHFDGYARAGVNRISIGAQSFSEGALTQLGRIHRPDDIHRSMQGARRSGIKRVNLDLMHGLPGQTVADALDDLNQAISLAPEHISWYQLTIEPNTRFYRYPPVLPTDEVLEDTFEAGHRLLAESGFRQYEVSAYATAGEESRHNRNYWEFGDYIGLGAGAHGKLTRGESILRTTKNRVPGEYLANPVGKQTAVDSTDLVLEFLLNTLRLVDGFSLTMFEDRTGLSRTELGPFLERGCRQNYLEPQDGTVVVPTEKGRLFLNDLLLLVDP